jgi:uncharacterized protein (DUF433 family)
MKSGVASLLDHEQRAPLSAGADGLIRIGRTRVTLDTLAEAFSEGATAEEIAQQYPSLSLADIYSVIAHILRREEQVSAYLAERARIRASVQKNNEARFNPAGIRARLLARRPATTGQ